tara:strand:- start:4278 stop:4694 length:417 start_codon:yes stop_codon:yes gene_type:complete
MTLTEINWNPNQRELRIFAVALACLFCFIAAFVYKITASISVATGMAGLIILLLSYALIYPDEIKPIYHCWMVLFYPVRWIVSCLLIAVVYYFVIFPIGSMLRLLGHDLLDSRCDPEAESYWKAKKVIRKKEDYFRQF